jgi:hypothetical protein
MSDTLEMETARADAEGGTEAECFGALVSALAEQIEHARQGRLEAVAETGRRVQALLEDVQGRGVQLDPDQQKRLLKLHDRVGLALAHQQREVGEALQRVRQGRKTLCAYDHAADD